MLRRLRAVLFLALAGCSLVTSLDGLSGGPDDAASPADASSDRITGGDVEEDAGLDVAAPDGDARVDAPIADADADAPIVDADADAPKTITWHGTTAASFNDVGATTFNVSRPANAIGGDLLIAGVALGNSGNATLPVFTPPSGFSLVRRTDHTTVTSLLVYSHVATNAEPATYVFTSDLPTEGQIWISAYANVHPTTPIDVDLGANVASVTTQYATPQVTASAAAARGLVLGSFAARGTAGAWTAPSGTTTRANLANSTSRSSLAIEIALAAPGVVAPMTASLPVAQDYGLTHVMVLRVAP